MPTYCSVYGCSCSSAKSHELSFFQFPKDAKLLKAWIARVRRENFTPTVTSYVCSRHFVESDLYFPNTDTPSVFKKRRLHKGAIPSVNLRGREEDERQSKRSSSFNRRSDPSEIATASTPQPEIDDKDLDISTCPHVVAPSTSNQNEHVRELLEKIAALEKRSFCYKNLSDADVKNYTGLENSVFQVVVEMVIRFSPLNYWSGKPVKSISPEDQLLIFLSDFVLICLIMISPKDILSARQQFKI